MPKKKYVVDLTSDERKELKKLISSPWCALMKPAFRSSLKVSAWETERSTSATKVNWQVTTEDAHIKSAQLYSSSDD